MGERPRATVLKEGDMPETEVLPTLPRQMPLGDCLIVLAEEVQARTRLAAEHKQAIDLKNARIHGYTKDLRERLANGETTGDPLKDLVLKTHGWDPEAEEKYAALERQLAGKKGEFVLLFYHSQRDTRHIFGRGWEHESADYYRIGVLEGEKLIGVEETTFTNATLITLPVSRYIRDTPGIFLESDKVRRPLEVREHDIFEREYHDPGPYPLGCWIKGKGSRLSELVIGDEAVKEWLDKRHMSGLYKTAADALSKLVLEPTEE